MRRALAEFTEAYLYSRSLSIQKRVAFCTWKLYFKNSQIIASAQPTVVAQCDTSQSLQMEVLFRDAVALLESG